MMNKRLFAIGDIHGCFDSLKELIEEKIQLTKSDTLVLLGDYIDRGPKSKEVIDYIIDLQGKGFDITALSGNHEQMLLDAYYEKEMVALWKFNGGSETLKSFRINKITDLQSIYLEFFKGLKLYFEFENYLFVHAGFNDEIENPFEDTYHMIWKCRPRYSHPRLKDKTIIHGHNAISRAICDERIKNNDPVINLDTGCVYKTYRGFGRLTAFELYTRQMHFV